MSSAFAPAPAAIAALVALVASTTPGTASAADTGWNVVGRQGLIAHVIAPPAQARDRAAYLAQLPAICGERPTCFVNFYTNSTGADTALPLPDAIAAEATAVLRKSSKQGVESFRWSCRLAMPEPHCF